MSTRLTRGIAVLGASALWAACAKGDKKADSAAAADSIAKAAAAATPPPAAAPAPAPLTDANILALLDEANAADSTNGAIAATKGTASDVKAFARDMMRDHHKLRADGQALAKKLNITPAPPAGDSIPALSQKESDNLNATAKGPDFDKAYINAEVGVHQFVVGLLQAAQGAATDTTLKATIVKVQPLIQAHLTKAQAIQTKQNAAKP